MIERKNKRRGALTNQRTNERLTDCDLTNRPTKGKKKTNEPTEANGSTYARTSDKSLPACPINYFHFFFLYYECIVGTNGVS